MLGHLFYIPPASLPESQRWPPLRETDDSTAHEGTKAGEINFRKCLVFPMELSAPPYSTKMDWGTDPKQRSLRTLQLFCESGFREVRFGPKLLASKRAGQANDTQALLYTKPFLTAQTATCVRSLTPTLRKICCTCSFTVS